MVWDAQAALLAAGKNALYSWRFHEAGDARYAVAIHAPTQKEACASHSSVGDDPSSDFWYLDLDFDASIAGTYQVGAAAGDAEASSLEATLVHRYRGAYAQTYYAVAGEVSLATAPTFSDSRAGTGLLLQGWLSWPSLPRTTVICSGSFPVEAGVAAAQASCLCRDPTGSESTCETKLFESCCKEATAGEWFTFDIPPTEARPCFGVCRVAVGLPDLCSQELGGPRTDGAAESGSLACRGSSCERKGWPQVALRFASDDILPADVLFIYPDGTSFRGDTQGGCPMWPPQVPRELGCDTGIIMGKSDKQVTVRVAPAGLVQAEVTVEVGPKNYCAVDIAYLTVGVADGAVVLSEPEFRSPCAELGL